MPGEQLHSRYNPHLEAERYIDALKLPGNIECFVLIEPGRGYLAGALKNKFKESKIIALHIDKNLCAPDIPVWHEGDAVNIQDFLEKEIPHANASLIRIIEWRPSMNFYKDAYLKLLSKVVEYIKQADAGRRTASVFGKRWVRNFFRNLAVVKEAVLYRETDIPVIVAGSGPSIEREIPVIRSMKDNCLVIAASSSILALESGGVSADIIIAADGGPWALKHLYPRFRASDNNAAVGNAMSGFFAAGLYAALPSQCAGSPLLILNDGSLWQSVILRDLALPSVIIQQTGTVTAAAVELALLLSRGCIYLAGMDLSVCDIRTHARPYAFDYLFSNSASRTAPQYSQIFNRSALMKEGGSLGIYAAWFKNQLNTWPKRIFSLSDGHNVFKNAPSFVKTNKKNTADFFKTAAVNNDSCSLSEKAVSSLLGALKNDKFSANIKMELMPLLFPGEKEVTDYHLETIINELAFQRHGKEHE